MATTAERRNIAPQKNRIGSQRAHWFRRWGAVSPYDREAYTQAVEMVKAETVDRERASRNFRRNIRQKETRQTAEMISREGNLAARRIAKKKNRLRMGCRGAEAVIAVYREKMRGRWYNTLIMDDPIIDLEGTYNGSHSDMHLTDVIHTPVQ